MKNHENLFKRIVAFLLTLVLVFYSGDFVGIAAAFAEGETIAFEAEQMDVVLPETEEVKSADFVDSTPVEQVREESVEQAVQAEADQEATEKADQKQAEKEAAEKVSKEQGEKAVAEKGDQEQAEKEAAEKSAQEQTEREKTEQSIQKSVQVVNDQKTIIKEESVEIEETQQEETPVEEKSVTEEEQQQEEQPIIKEPVVAEEQQQEEQSTIEEPVVAEEQRQEEQPIIEEPVTEEEQQQEEQPIIEEPVTEEEQQQEEQSTIEEPVVAEEQQQEEQSTIEEPVVAEEQRQEEQSTIEEPVVAEEQRQEEQSTIEEPVVAEEQQQEEQSTIEEPVVAEEQQQEEQSTIEEPVVAEEQRQEEQPIIEEPVTEEEQQQEEQSTIEEPVVAEEQRQEEQSTIEEPVVAEEQQQEEQSIIEEPVVAEEQQQEEQSTIEEPVVAEEQRQEETTAVNELFTKEETQQKETPAITEPPEEQPQLKPADGFIESAEEAETEPETALVPVEVPRTLEIQVGDFSITVTGNLPEGAEIQAVEIPADAAEEMTGEKSLFGYDIRILVDGQVWQPEDDKENVQISIQDVNGNPLTQDVEIVHVKTDLMEANGSLSEEAVEKAVEGLADGNVAAERIDAETTDGMVSFETDSFSGFVANALATLEKLFKNAMDSRKAGDKSVRINLEKDTTYDGDATFASVGYDVDDDFEVELVAEDAGEDYLQSAGTTIVAGNITIKGINVTMMGIAMVAGKSVTLDNARLSYYGTKENDDLVVNISGDKDKAEIHTGEGDDTVQVTAEAGSVSVDTGVGNDEVELVFSGDMATVETGADNDTVHLTAKDADSVTVDTSDGNDTVFATVQNSIVVINTGAGDDSMNASLEGSEAGSLTIETEAGSDAVMLSADAALGTTVVKTGDGSDTVDVDVETAGKGITINTDAGDDTVSLAHTGTNQTPANGPVEVTLGDGDDTALVDILIADGTKALNIDAGADEDVLHLSGYLNPDVDEEKRAIATETETGLKMELTGRHKNKLAITSNNFDFYSDELENKRTVTLTPAAGILNYSSANGSFTNFVIDAPANTLKNVTVTSADNASLVFSGVVINTPAEVDRENKVVINEGTVIDARGMKLTVEGKNIEINGTLKAATVSIQAKAGGKTENPGERIDLFILDQIESGDLFNVINNAKIVIGASGAVFSSGDVMMLAQVEQSGGIINVPIESLKAVNVKIGRASVDIAGQVYAGYTFAPTNQFDMTGVSERGSVRVNAQVKTTLGLDKKGKAESAGLALAVTVVDADASVNVQKGAVVEADKSVTLGSKTEVNVATQANSGTAGTPFSAAVAVLVSDVHTDVNGTVTSRNGSVKITADGKLTADTLANKGSGDENISGGFTAVTVALQDVQAKVSGMVNAASGSSQAVGGFAAEENEEEIPTGEAVGASTSEALKTGSVQVLANAAENVKNQAVSASSDKKAKESGSNYSASDLLAPLKGSLTSKVKDLLKNDASLGRVGQALDKIPVANSEAEQDGALTDDSDPTEDDLFAKKEESGPVNLDDILGDVKNGTDEEDKSGKTQVMGAVAITVGTNNSQALVDTGAQINVGRTTEVKSILKTDVYTFGDGRASAPKDTEVDTALGTGVAVGIVDGESRADLMGKVLSIEKISVTSDSTGMVKTEAKAGYNKGDIGIGGAVSVQVASLDSKALIHKTADLKTNSRLAVDANTNITFSLNADASGKTGKNTGIGAGITITVDGADTYAAIQDGMKLGTISENKKVTGISITTKHIVYDLVKALNGAAGGTSVVPVAAVNVIGTGAEAYLGKIAADPLKINGNVLVSAKSYVIHEMKAETTSAGAGTAVGTGVSVSVVSDESNARLNQSLEAKDVTVHSETISSIVNRVAASASGGNKEKNKSADGQADGLLNTAGKLAGKNNSKSISTAQIEEAKSENRQKIETGEGSVGVAGAVLLNVHRGVSIAEIMQGVNVNATGTVTVSAVNVMTSKAKADASSTNSDVGVGIGAAVNIIYLKNIAQIGDGEIKAAILNVTAKTNVTEPAEQQDEKETLRKLLSEQAEEFITELMDETGLDQYVNAEKLEEIKANMLKEISNLLSELSNIDIEEAKTRIAKALRKAAIEAYVAMTNEALSAMSDRFDLSLKAAAPKATGNIIDTQAISGAGTRDIGVAGSVAITVFNAENSAVIADGAAISVTGDMTVEAKELHSVNNVASAETDKKGKASANKNAGSAETKDAGSSAESVVQNSKETVKLTVGVGGTAQIDDEKANRPRMYIKLEDGYKMPDGNKVAYSFDDGSGFEITGNLTAQKDKDGRWYVDTNSEELSKGILTSKLSLEVKPVAIDFKVPAPDVLSTDSEDSGKVTIKVDNGEKTGDEKKEECLTAHVGDKVELKIEKAEGRKVSKLLCGYTDKSGSYKELQLAKGTETDKDIAYTFDMPAANIERFVVVFDDDGKGDSKTAAKDNKGSRVGVGAAFSMVYGESTTAAEIGKRGSVSAGALSVTAVSEHEEDIASAAGTDPLLNETDPEKAKKTAADASVALNILDNDIKASVSEGTAVSTKQGDLSVSAQEKSVTETTASAFSVGDKTAIGATVAANIANSSVTVDMLADATVAGNAAISANSYSEDTTKAIATATGADIARILKKLDEKTDEIEMQANKLLDGSIIDELDDSKAEENKTADKINARLNEKKKQQENKEEDAKTNANKKNSLSSNILRTQDVKAQGENAGIEGTQAVEDKIRETTGQEVSANRKENGDDNKKWQVAAAVGLTVSSHEAAVTVSKITTNKKIQVSAVNSGNFSTLGTAATISQAEHANSIAAGVAVSVNSNKAQAQVKQNQVSNDQDDITITSRLTQNLDGDFAGRLAAQSLSGSVAGQDSDVSIAGAISVLVSNGESIVDIASSKDARTELNGGDITVEATDKSKLAIRAGGVSLSKGSNIGMGLSSATVVSSNNVAAAVGDYTTVEGKSFKLNAEKQAVTLDDYKSLIDQKYFVTDSSSLTDAQRKEADTGLIDIHKGEDDKNYKMEISLSSEKLLDAVNGLNFLSSQNTYVEAISGSVMSGKGKAGVAGSFAVAVTNSKVNTALGSYVTVKLTGDMSVTAKNGSEDKAATTRIIAGSLGAGEAKAAVGVTVAVLVNNDQVKAETKESSKNNKIDIDGSFTQKAVNSGEIQVFTGAMAVAAGSEGGAAVGGAVNVILNNSAAESVVGKNALILAKKSVNIQSDTRLDLIGISGSANVSAGSGAEVAAGGVVNVIVDNATADTTLAEGVALEQFNETAAITSNVSDRMLTGTASLSAAPTGSGKAVAGVANVIVSNSKAHTTLNENAWATGSYSGDVKITANNDAYLLNAGLSLAGASSVAVGAAFNVNVLNREALVNMKDRSGIACSGDAVIQATGRDTKILAGLSAGGSMDSAAVSGNVAVLAESSKIKTLMGNEVRILPGNNAIVESHLENLLVDVAGNIAASGSSAAVGVASVTVVKNNEVITDLGKSEITADVKGNAVKNKSGEDVSGVYVGANARETEFVGGAGVAATGGSAAVNGVVTVLVNNNKVLSDASKAKLTGENHIQQRKWRIYAIYTSFDRPLVWKENLYGTIASDAELTSLRALLGLGRTLYYVNGKGLAYKKLTNIDDVTTLIDTAVGEVSVKASDDTKQLLLAGGISASSSASVGAAVVTLVSSKDVEAKAHEAVTGKNITVSAENKDDIKQLAISAGVSGSASVQVGAAVQVLKSKALAEFDGEAKTMDGDFNLTANNDTTLYNIGASVAGSGSAAVAPVGVVTYFQGETAATLKSGSAVEAQNVNIKSTANKDINMFAVGAAFSGAVGVSGAASVLVSKDTNKATAAESAAVNASDSLNVEAQSDYELLAASGAIAGAGEVSVGVNAVVSILKSNSIAEIGSQVNARNVNVKAYGKRDVVNVGASMAGAGVVGAGVTVMVLSAGAAMSQDAADMIMYGNGSQEDKDKGNKTGFDAAKFMDTAESNGVESKYYSDILNGKTLEADMKGNGHHETAQQIGSKKDDGNIGFDASSKYRSKDLDDKTFNNDSDTGRGENLSLTTEDGVDNSDTADVKAAKSANTYHYYDPTDFVIARITDKAVVDAQQVTVEATQPVTIDLLGAALGGGAVGVGVSTAVAILHSNVSASSMGEIKNANITLNASSVSGEIKTDADAKERKNTMADLMANGDKPQDKYSLKDDLLKKVENRSIRVFGVAVGIGAVGVAVSASVALTDNTTQALLGGKVTGAGDISVTAKHNYGAVMAGTGALGGGTVGVGASASVAQANGRVNALLMRGAEIESSKNVNISTESKVDVDALAVTVGGGAVGVNAGVGLAFNRLQQETAIDMGASVTASGDVNLTADVDSSAHSYLLGVSAGAVAGSLNAAVTDVAATVKTHIGQSVHDVVDGQNSLTNDEEEFPIATVKAKNVSVKNNVKQSLSEPVLLSVAAGGVALGGNVLLAFNNTHAEAMIDNGDVTAETLDLVSNLNGSAKSSLTAAQVGAIAVGLSVNYADMRAYNTAHIRNSAIKTTVKTSVETNRKAKEGDNDFSATAGASTVAANIGLITVGLNAAIARNNSGNYATVIGDGSRIMDFGELYMHARGNSSATASLDGISFSKYNIAASTVVALNDADTRTTVLATKLKEGEYTMDPPEENKDPDGEGETFEESVKNRTNVIAKSGLTLDVTSTGSTDASVTTGGGSLVGAALNVAMAYGRTASLVDAVIHGGGEYAFVSSTNTARSNTTSTINNSDFSAISMAARYGAAYSQDIFRSSLQQTGGTFKVTGNLNMLTDYETKTTATVTPSTSGLSARLGTLEANVALARNTAMASAEYEKSIDEGYSDSEIGGNVTIKAMGSAIVEAEVIPAALRISGLSAGANIATADLSVVQAAALSVGGRMTVGGSVDVTSDVKSGSGNERLARAKASIGGVSAGNGNYAVNLVGVDVSKAVARENMYNSAIVRGGAYGVEKVEAMVDKGNYKTTTVTDYDYDLVESYTYKLTNYRSPMTYTSSEDEDIVRKWFAENIGLMDLSEGLQADASRKRTQAFCRQIKNDADGLLLGIRKSGREPTKEEMDKVCKSIYEYYIHNSPDLLGSVAGYVRSASDTEIIRKVIGFSEQDLEGIGSYAYINYFEDRGWLKWEETPNYAKTEQTKSVWEEKWEKMEVEVPIYSIDKNHLNVNGNLNIYAHSATGSEARTDSAKTLSLVSAGSSKADAISTDYLSAILEGMHVEAGGDMSIAAKSDTRADGTGYQAGGFSIASATKHDSKARVGTNDQRQFVGVIVGDNANIVVHGNLSIQAVNEGVAKASMESGKSGSFSLVSGSSSSQPTESWYNTLISIGQKTRLFIYKDITIRSSDTPTAESIADTKNVSLLANFNTMKGQNLVRQENNIDFGSSAYIHSDSGRIVVEALQKTIAQAETINGSKALGVSGSNVQATNFIDRVARVNTRDVEISSNLYPVTISARSGEGDKIYTRAYIDSAGLVSVPKATATADVTSNAEIIVGEGASIDAHAGLRLEALATSYEDHKNSNENNPGITTIAQVDALGLVAVPNAVAKNNLTVNTYVQINDFATKNNNAVNGFQKIVFSDTGNANIDVLATNRGFTAKADASAQGKGGGGVSNATAWNIANMQNVIWANACEFDMINFMSPDVKINLIATNGDSGRDRTHLISKSYAALDGIAGKVAPTSRITGQQVNQVRTDDEKSVAFKGPVNHQASKPENVIWDEMPASYKRWEIVINLLFTKITITLTKSTVVQKLDWAVFDRCDFCSTGQSVDVRPTAQETIEQRYKNAYDNALLPLALIKSAALGLGLDPNATIGAHLARGLLPLTYLNTLVSRPGVRPVASNGLNGMAYSDKMELTSLLKKDTRPVKAEFDLNETNVTPNKNNMDEIFLVSNDVVNPVLTIREKGELSLASGMFTILPQTEVELYLNEISAKWLIDSLNNDFIRALIANQETVNAFMSGNGELPQGVIIEEITEETDAETGRKLYWLGYTPETAPADNTPLLLLTVDAKNDLAAAYRTTRALYSNGEKLIPASLLIVRDVNQADKVCYTLVFFDTPAGEESTFTVMTGAQPFSISLRAVRLDHVSAFAYFISGIPVFVEMTGTGFILLDGEPVKSEREWKNEA